MACLTEPCPTFQRGACLFTRPAACFFYHTESQRRREVVGELNQILYWDILCPYMSGHTSCSYGDRCSFSHTRTEICYHPARFRTKLCNGFECRGSVCCFAHSNQELRTQAPTLYGASGTVVPLELAEGVTECISSDDSSTIGSISSSRHANGIPMTRLCASYPSIENCEFADKCPFAHDVMELLTPLLYPTESEFFMRFFKTEWCVFSHHHDWNNCIYAHNSQDCRRPPSLGYGPSACSSWDLSDPRLPYSERCRHGLLCPFAHGRKEQLYHPGFYRTNECCDWRRPLSAEGGACIRGEICAFYHGEYERRFPQPVIYNYDKLLNEETVNSTCAHLKERPILVSAYPTRQATIQKVVQGENIDMNEFLKFALF